MPKEVTPRYIHKRSLGSLKFNGASPPVNILNQQPETAIIHEPARQINLLSPEDPAKTGRQPKPVFDDDLKETTVPLISAFVIEGTAVLEKHEDNTLSNQTTFSPPAEATRQPTIQSTPKAEITIKTQKEQMLANSTLYILSMITDGHIDHEVFRQAKDDKLKKEFTVGFASVLERFWNLNPESLKHISKVERKMITKCMILKRQGYSIREIVQETCGRLGIIPPRRYR